MSVKHIFGGMRLAHISMAFAGSMLVLPFLYYYHGFIPTFYQEWWAAALGLCAMPLLMSQRYWKQPEIPRIALLPVGLVLLILIQSALGKVAYLEQALLVILHLLWSALLAMLGHRLRAELGLPVLATALAVCLLLGAELNALVGVLQFYAQRTHHDFALADYLGLARHITALDGNLAQPNHFANYITLGLFSLGLLYFCRQLRGWQAALLAVPLLFVLAFSGSRSPWLYLLCMTGMAFLWWRRDKANLRLLRYSLLLVLGFGLMHFAGQLPWLTAHSGGVASAGHVASVGHVTSGERLIAGIGVASGSIRLQIWREAWLIFTQFPLLGAGFGQFAWQHFQLGPALRNANITGVYTNAHNLVLQLAAEMGLVGVAILLGALALWFWQARNAQRTIYHWWGYGLLAVLAIHSLLEYPLWYTFFLGIAALTLGIFDTTSFCLKLRGKHPVPTSRDNRREAKHGNSSPSESDVKLTRPATEPPLPGAGEAVAPPPLDAGLGRVGFMGRLSVLALLVLGLLSLSQMLSLYRDGNFNFETLAKVLGAPATADSYAQRIRVQLIHDKIVAEQGRTLLLRPYFDMFLSEAEWDHVADKGALNERVMHFFPTSGAVYRKVWLLARAGQQAEACVQIERAIWAYPGDFPESLEALRELEVADTASVRFPALLECAPQKYAERQRVVDAK